MNIEDSKKPVPSQAEQDAIAESRALSDADLLRKGARIENGKIVDVTQDDARHEMLLETLAGYKEIFEAYEILKKISEKLEPLRDKAGDFYKLSKNKDLLKLLKEVKHDMDGIAFADIRFPLYTMMDLGETMGGSDGDQEIAQKHMLAFYAQAESRGEVYESLSMDKLFERVDNFKEAFGKVVTILQKGE